MTLGTPYRPERAKAPAGQNSSAAGPASRIPFSSRRFSKLLGRLSLPWATAILVGVAVGAALACHLIIGWLFGMRLEPEFLLAAAAASVIVATPIIAYSQVLIRSLRNSRRTLEQMTEHLALALDAAEQANNAKSDFLANMSHELRTPLNAIIGFSDVMRHQRFGPVSNAKYLEYAKDINDSGEHLLSIINDILDLSKIEAGRTDLQAVAEFAVATTVEMAARLARPLAERQGVRLDVAPPPAPIGLTAVERMVRQVLINVLSNAVKFTPSGGAVQVNLAWREGGDLAIRVADTGVGMSADEIKVALMPFGQVANAFSRRHAGTGLGLPLAKAMMELHGGRLAIRSAPREGTTVSLIFPASRVSPMDAANPAKPSLDESAGAGKTRVDLAS
ncbi:MAG TPA: HAMP domain-containing sensor histidine kinase [Candidatus Cybelea sp.]|nr:HAMP domain-containing sensor histidine kinase [Candidatus Cybelea sp.]